jgi:hypothetical protein
MSQLKLYNKSIIKMGVTKPFESHNIAEELINKPIQSDAKLCFASSLKPYAKPETLNKYQSTRSFTVSTKLVPIFQSKKYNKLKGLLPAIIGPGTSKKSLILP